MSDRDTLDAEDLIARARRGALSRAEEQALARALEERPELAVAYRVGVELDRASAVQGGDDALIARSADAALSRVADMNARSSAGTRTLAAAAALVTVIFASGIAAALVSGAVSWPFDKGDRAPSVERPARNGPGESRAKPKQRVDPAPPSVPVSPPPSVSVAPPVAEPVVARKRSSARTETAADLFRDANAARRGGDLTAARRTYAALIEQHPSSDEASVARVSLGKLLLAAGQAQAAEREFRRYITSGHAQLEEEALVGQAQSFGSLNRVQEERQAWQRLLTEHPSTVYAAQAKQRLAALEAQR